MMRMDSTLISVHRCTLLIAPSRVDSYRNNCEGMQLIIHVELLSNILS